MPPSTTPRPLRLASAWRPVVLAVTVGAATLMAGCGTDAPSRDEMTEAFVDSGLPDDVAACAAAAIEDSLSTDELVQLVERGSSGAPVDDPSRTDDAADQVRDALAQCRADLT